MAQAQIGSKWNRATVLPVLDRAEQVLIAGLYLLLTWRVINAPNPFAPLLLVSEGSVLLFTLLRRPTGNLSFNPLDWVLALIGTVMPLLIVPVADRMPAVVPLGVALFAIGALVQVAAKLVLRRSFGVTAANRGVKRAGPYKLVRHPMYAGYFLSNIGLLLLMFSPLNLWIYAVAWAAQVGRIVAEERLLSQDPAYAAYMGDTRWRVIPGVF